MSGDARRVRHRAESGAASLLAATVAGVLVLTALVVAVLGGLLADHRRAEAAADLAALAGAVAVQHHRPGCEAARTVAERNGAVLLGCEVDGEAVRVRTAIPSRVPVAGAVEVPGTATAGPVPPGDPR